MSKSPPQSPLSSLYSPAPQSPTGLQSPLSSPYSPEPKSPTGPQSPIGSPYSPVPPNYQQSEKDSRSPFFSPSTADAARLAEIAAANGHTTIYTRSILPRPRAQPSFASAADKATAKDLLVQRRKTDPEYKKPGLFSSKPKDGVFDPKEVNRALKDTVIRNGSAGLIEALLAYGGDVNVHRRASTNTIKKLQGKDVDDVRSDVMVTATKTGSLQTVQLLASRADAQSLSEALPMAVKRGDPKIVRALVEWDAGHGNCHDEFMAVVHSNDENITELLLQATQLPCSDCLTTALVTASQKGSIRTVGSLVGSGFADANHQNAAALRSAIAADRLDITLAILQNSKSPSVTALDEALGHAYNRLDGSNERQAVFLEACLAAGARGEHSAAALLKALQRQQIHLVTILVRYGISVDYNEGAAIKLAIERQQVEMVELLMTSRPRPETLSSVIKASTEYLLKDFTMAYEVLRRLIGAGASAGGISDLLLEVLGRSSNIGYESDMRAANPAAFMLIRLLVEQGQADVGLRGGLAIQIVASSAIMDLLELFLSRQPPSSSLEAAFLAAINLPETNPKRLQIVRMLLNAGLQGTVIDQCLVGVARSQEPSMELAKILLIMSSVDYNHGEALRECVQRHHIPLFNLLLSQKPSTPTMEKVWQEAGSLPDLLYQYAVFGEILLHGDRGAPLDKELVRAAEAGPDAFETCKLLLRHGGSVDHDNGAAMVRALLSGHLNTFQYLLSQNPKASSITPVFLAIQKLTGPARRKLVSWILAAEVGQIDLDLALLSAIKEPTVDLELIGMYLNAKASPDYEEGASMIHAATTQNLPALRLLVPGSHDRASLGNTLDAVLDSDALMATEAGLEIVRFLLSYGAVGKRYATAFIRTAKTLNEDGLKALTVNNNVPLDTVNRALKELSDYHDGWHSPKGLPIVQHLLDCGATGYDVDLAFIKASGALALDAVNLLSDAVKFKLVITVAFDKATENASWYSEPDVIEVLLERGVDVEPVNDAFLRAIEAHETEDPAEDLLDTLLAFGVDVDFMDGQALRSAIRYGDVELLKKLMTYQPSDHSLTMALVDTMLFGHDDALVVAFIDILTSDPDAGPDMNYAGEDIDGPMFLCLQRYGDSVEVVQRMLDGGASMDATVYAYVYDELHLSTKDMQGRMSKVQQELLEYEDDAPSGALVAAADLTDEREDVPVVLWALTQTQQDGGVSDEVIELLYDWWRSDEDVINETTPHSHTSALILAARYGRSTVVQKLLEDGALTNAKDRWDCSALFYASQAGRLDIVKMLLKKKSPVNDGSLHEAARELHGRVVDELVRARHDPNFVSYKHGGRTALAELCYSCATRDKVKLEEVLAALARGNALPLQKYRGKNALFLALDNPVPAPMVIKLVECIMYRQINHPDNVYQENDLIYSPTKYIEKHLLKACYDEDSRELLRILTDFNAMDRYYTSERKKQPEGAVGMPDDIKDIERKRLIREEKLMDVIQDHERALQHAREEDEQARRLQARAYEQKYVQTEESAAQKARHEQFFQDQKLAHRAELHGQDAKFKDDDHHQKTYQMQMTASLKADIAWRQHNDQEDMERQARETKLQFERQQYQDKFQALDVTQRMKLRHNYEVDEQKLKTQAQLNYEKAQSTVDIAEIKVAGQRDMDHAKVLGLYEQNKVKSEALAHMNQQKVEGVMGVSKAKVLGLRQLNEEKEYGTRINNRAKVQGVRDMNEEKVYGTRSNNQAKAEGVRDLNEEKVRGTRSNNKAKAEGVRDVNNEKVRGTNMNNLAQWKGKQAMNAADIHNTRSKNAIKNQGARQQNAIRNQGTMQQNSFKEQNRRKEYAWNFRKAQTSISEEQAKQMAKSRGRWDEFRAHRAEDMRKRENDRNYTGRRR